MEEVSSKENKIDLSILKSEIDTLYHLCLENDRIKDEDM
jgi:hypothetical protein